MVQEFGSFANPLSIRPPNVVELSGASLFAAILSPHWADSQTRLPVVFLCVRSSEWLDRISRVVVSPQKRVVLDKPFVDLPPSGDFGLNLAGIIVEQVDVEPPCQAAVFELA